MIYFGFFTSQTFQVILAEYIDLLQGRIPKSVFARHYLKVEDVKGLVAQVLDVTENLVNTLIS